MKKGYPRTEFAKWIIPILLTCLISACGTLDQVEALDQVEGTSQASILTQQATEGSKPAQPTDSPTVIETPSSPPPYTPSMETEATGVGAIIPHFPPGESVTITTIKMNNPTTGWAIGRDQEHAVDHILTTSDGGHTWRDVTPEETTLQEVDEFTYKMSTAFFLDGQSASLIYDPDTFSDPARIWSTSSAGYQWDESIIETNFQIVEGLSFADESHGWLMLGVDAGMGHSWVEVYRTSDGGREWELTIDPYSEASANLHYCCKTGMVFHDSNTGLISFGRGPMGGAFVNWTHDGGMTWEASPLPRPEGAFQELEDSEYGILCESHSPTLFSNRSAKVALECWTDFDASDEVSFIFSTLDGGTTWNALSYPGGQLLFLTPEMGWAFGNEIYQTLDGGQIWTKMSTVPWDGKFSFVNQQLGWATAQMGEVFSLFQTEDGGKTWEPIEPIVVE
jgi:photosystem II stability/assembly factor-like uncharacterized protein